MNFTQKVDLGLKMVDESLRTSFKNASLFIYLPIYYFIITRMGIKISSLWSLTITDAPSFTDIAFSNFIIPTFISLIISHYIYTKITHKKASIGSSLYESLDFYFPLVLYYFIPLLAYWHLNHMFITIPLVGGLSVLITLLLRICVTIAFYFVIPFIVVRRQTIKEYLKMSFAMWPTMVALSLGMSFVGLVVVFALIPITLLLYPVKNFPASMELVAHPINFLYRGSAVTLATIMQTVTYLKCLELYQKNN